jgi:hypothetical protein
MPVSDAVFYPLNSYYCQSEKREDVLNRACTQLGAESRFALLFFAHIEANLTLEAPADATYERIAEAAGCLAEQAGIAHEIADTGFKLSAGFRDSTTPAYFELLDCSREYHALATAGWLGQVHNQHFARAVARAFWEAAGKV